MSNLESTAKQLIEVARNRQVAINQYITVGELVDSEAQWDDPHPTMRCLIWRTPHADSPHSLAFTIRRLLSSEIRNSISNAYLLAQVKDAAYELGQVMLTVRHHDFQSNAQRQLHTLVTRIDKLDDHWDIVLPIVNLHLESSASPITIGPVQIIRDNLGSLFPTSGVVPSLGEFGSWAIQQYGSDDADERARMSGHFGQIFAYAKVAGIRGDHQFAIEQARDIDTALSILRIIYFMHGSWSGRATGLTGPITTRCPGSDVMGTTVGGLRITLSAKSKVGNNGAPHGQPGIHKSPPTIPVNRLHPQSSWTLILVPIYINLLLSMVGCLLRGSSLLINLRSFSGQTTRTGMS